MNSKILTGLVLSLGLLAGAPQAEACKCLPPTVSASYNDATDVVRTQVVYGVTVGQSRWYLTRVLGTYKGCLKPGSWLYVRTGSSSASCGLDLKNGVQYLINGALDTTSYKAPVISAGSCGYNKAISQLTKSDRKYLSTRYNCCGKECACVNGKPPVNCFVDPCQVADCPAGQCESNYCGGCNAEFYDDYGAAICQPCKDSAGCGYHQVCSNDGMCLPTCASDEDCNKGFWCRPTQESAMTDGLPQGTCTAYAQDGDSCGGFVPVWWATQCAPGLICTDFPDMIADAPGKCRQPCKSNEDCSESQYCGSGDVCRDDGGCKSQGDCSASGNSYITVKCLGYALCVEDQCNYKCGSPTCPNLSGIFFGYCDMVLGVANIDGKCQSVSGCDSDGLELFESTEACEQACGFEPSPSCDDIGKIDFGACEMVLGVAVVGGQCSYVSGCGAKGYTFFADMDACTTACGK